MKKSSIIIGIVAFIVALGVTLITPIIVPCFAIFLGFAAGALACVFDKPESGGAARTGAIAGALSGIGALLGQIGGAVINGIIVGPEGAAQLIRALGIDPSGSAAGYWIGLAGSTLCIGLINVLFMAGCGALGGLIWQGLAGKKTANPPAPPVI